MSRLISNSVFAVSGNAINAIFSFAFIVLITNRYGVGFFGTFSFSQTVFLLCFVAFKPNIWQNLVRHYHHKDDNDVVLNFFFIDLIFSFICVFFSFLVVFVLFREALCLFFLFIPYVFFFNSGFVVGLLRLKNNFILISIVQILSGAIKLLMLFAFDFFKANDVLSCCFIVDGILGFMLYFYVCKKYVDFSSAFSFFNIKSKRSLFKVCIGLHMSTLFDLPVVHLDKIIIGLFLNDYYLGVYALIKRICQCFSILIEPLSYVLFPIFSLQQKKNIRHFRKIIISYTAFVFALCFVAMFSIYFLFDYLNVYFLKSQLADFYNILVFAVISQFLALSFNWVHSIFISYGFIYANNIITLSSNLLYLLALSCLVYFYGMFGAFFALFFQFVINIGSKFVYIYSKNRF